MTVRRRPVSRDSRRRCFFASSRVEPLTDVTRLLTGASADGARRADPGHRVGRIVAFPTGQFEVLVATAAATAAARRHAVFERPLGAFFGFFRRCLRHPSVSDSASLAGAAASAASAAAAPTAAAGVFALAFFAFFFLRLLGGRSGGRNRRTTVVRSGAWKIIDVTAPGSRNSEAAGRVPRPALRRCCGCCCGGRGAARRQRRLRRAAASSALPAPGRLPRPSVGWRPAASAAGAAALARLARRRTGFSSGASAASAPATLLAGASAAAAAGGFGGSRRRMRAAVRRGSAHLAGAGAACRAPWPWLRSQAAAAASAATTRRAGCFGRAAAAAAASGGGCDVGSSGAALRRVRTARFGGAATAASAVLLLHRQRLALRCRLQPGHYPYVATLLPLTCRHIRHPLGQIFVNTRRH